MGNLQQAGRLARRVLPLAAGTLILVGCGATGEESGASCPDVIDYHGSRYTARIVATVPDGDRLGAGRRPSCSDGPSDPVPGDTVTVYEIAGIDPELAVSLGSDTDSIYVSDSAQPDAITTRLGRLLRR